MSAGQEKMKKECIIENHQKYNFIHASRRDNSSPVIVNDDITSSADNLLASRLGLSAGFMGAVAEVGNHKSSGFEFTR